MAGLQVLEAAPAAPVVIIADCPTPAHLPALLSSSAWEPFQHHSCSSEAAAGKSSTHEKVNCIVHLAPHQVGAAASGPYLSCVGLSLLECDNALPWLNLYNRCSHGLVPSISVSVPRKAGTHDAGCPDAPVPAVDGRLWHIHKASCAEL